MRGAVLVLVAMVPWSTASGQELSPAERVVEIRAAALVEMLAGEYSNAGLVRDARARNPESQPLPVELREIHHMFATPVVMPHVAGETVYVEWRHDGRGGDISGQRVWTFTDTEHGVAMRFYTLHQGAVDVLSGVTAPTAATEAVSLADLRGYPEACTIFFHVEEWGFVGRNEPGLCSFPMRSGDGVMKVDATLTISPDLHGERTEISRTTAGAAQPAPVEVEDWVYLRSP